MSAVDRIRKALNDERPAWADDLGERKIILDVGEAKALCDVADAARAHLGRKKIHDPSEQLIGNALTRLDAE